MEAYSRAMNKALVPFQQSTKPSLGSTTSSIHVASSVMVLELTGRKQHSARKQCMYPVAGREPGKHPLCRETRDHWYCWPGSCAIINVTVESGSPTKRSLSPSSSMPAQIQWMCQQDNRTSLRAALTQITFKCAISHSFYKFATFQICNWNEGALVNVAFHGMPQESTGFFYVVFRKLLPLCPHCINILIMRINWQWEWKREV